MKLKTSLLGVALCLGAALPVLAQTGTMDNGTMSSGTMSGGTMSGGTMSGGTMSGGMMNGSMMAMSAQDQLFMTRAAEGNLAEITLGQMAQSKTRNAGVKNVAQTIIAGHSQAQTELMGLMRRKGMAMTPMLSATHMAVSDALRKQKRDGFDRMYMAGQVDDHENTIALFQTEVMNGQDPDLKAYATKYLPDIVGHTLMIYAVARQVGAPGIQMRPMMPPIPPGVTPTMMGRPIDMTSTETMMNSMGMNANGTMMMNTNGGMMNGGTPGTMNGNMGTNGTMTPLNTTPAPTP
jgi:putative membrane protein